MHESSAVSRAVVGAVGDAVCARARAVSPTRRRCSGPHPLVRPALALQLMRSRPEHGAAPQLLGEAVRVDDSLRPARLSMILRDGTAPSQRCGAVAHCAWLLMQPTQALL